MLRGNGLCPVRLPQLRKHFVAQNNELLLEAPESELAETRELIRECMENALPLSVPLQVDFRHAANRLEAH